MSVPESIPVHIVFFGGGVKVNCIKCNKLISAGLFCLALTSGAEAFVVARSRILSCCGERGRVYELFETYEDAEEGKQNLETLIREYKDDPEIELIRAPLGIIEFNSSLQVLH